MEDIYSQLISSGGLLDSVLVRVARTMVTSIEADVVHVGEPGSVAGSFA